jgi:hypothetical protein
MISERQAVAIIEDELTAADLKHLHIKHLYDFLQVYASKTVELGEQQDLQKFEVKLIVADRLYTEGSLDLKEIMENVYMSLVSHCLKLHPDLMRVAKGHLPQALMAQIRKDQLSNHS